MEEIKRIIFSDINRISHEIKKCKSKSRYEILFSDIEKLYYLCQELNIEDYPKIEFISNKSFNINHKKYLYRYEEAVLKMEPYHLRFTDNINDVDIYKYMEERQFILHNTVVLDNNLELAVEFFLKYDIKLYELFLYLLKNNKIIQLDSELLMDKETGTCMPAFIVYSFGSFDSYIFLNIQNDITDSINLIHEIGHGCDLQKTAYISSKVLKQKKLNFLEEVFPYFLQFVYIEYLKHQKIYSVDLDKAILGVNYAYIKSTEKLKECLNLDYIPIDIDEHINYSYGIAIAYHLFDRYKIDPEKTKKEVDDFIMMNGQYDMLQILERYHLKDELIDSKILKKYI